MVSSSLPQHQDVNTTTTPRSAGSTLKPFLYADAIERRILTAASLLPDTEEAIRGTYSDYDPQNYNHRFLGPVRVREALGNSLNVPAVVTLGRLGARETFAKLATWGFRFRENFDACGAGFILGNAEITMLDLAGAYASLARGGEAWRAAHVAATPVVHILRSYFLLCWQGAMFRRGQNCAGPCLECRLATVGRRDATRRLSGIVGITRFILQAHQDAGLFASQAAAGQTVILPDPVMEISAARSAGHSLRFGFLGMLTPNKGVERLLETWALHRPEGSVLSIAGTGRAEYVASLKAVAPDGVEFTGWVSSEDFLDTIDFLIVPSVWNEPFGRIVVEAFARGVPVLGSRTGGIPELIDVGQTGDLFDSTEASIRDVIARAAQLDSDAYRWMSANCIAAASRYLPKKLSAEYVAYFEAVIRGYSPTGGVTSSTD